MAWQDCKTEQYLLQACLFVVKNTENKHVPVSSLAFEWVQTKCTLLLAAGLFSALREENFINNQNKGKKIWPWSTTKLTVVVAMDYLLCLRKTETLPCTNSASAGGKFLVQKKAHDSPHVSKRSCDPRTPKGCQFLTASTLVSLDLVFPTPH